MKDEIKETNDLWVKINDNDIKEVLDYYKRDIESYEKRALNGYGISNKEAYQRYKNHKLILYHINDLREKVEDLREDNYAYHQLIRMENKREYRSKFLKEFQEEFGTNTFPDYDEIYKRYDKLKKENKRLKETNKEQANHLISKDNLSYEDYKSRNKKAIEFIEHENFKRTLLGFSENKYLKNIQKELLNILGGDE